MNHPATLIKSVWAKYVGNLKAILLATLPWGVAMALFNLGTSFLTIDSIARLTPFAYVPRFVVIIIVVVLVLVYFAFAVLSSIAIFLNANKVYNNEKAELVGSYKKGLNLFFPVLFVSVIRSLIVLGGTLLLIVPGIIWGLRYAFAEQAVIAEGKRGMAALRRSKEITNGKLFRLFVNTLVLAVVLVGGVWLATIAITVVVFAFGLLASSFATGSDLPIAISRDVVYALIMIFRWFVYSLLFLSLVAMYRDFTDKQI
jgi:hypothetical protein